MKGALPILALAVVAYLIYSSQQAPAPLPGQTGRTIPAADYEVSAGRTAGIPINVWTSPA